MDENRKVLEACGHFVHAHFLKLLVGSYAVAAAFPGPGLRIRDISLGHVGLFGASTRVSLSMFLLSTLLLNAGLGIRAGTIRDLLRRPSLLAAGLLTNLLLPIAYILAVTTMLGAWHNADEVQNILVGLALVASMPIAGSSTAWSQNADGDLTLSLGLILFSTFLSPLTTPLALRSIGLMATGDYAEDLQELARGGTGLFLVLCVLLPSLLGMGGRVALGDRHYQHARPGLKLLNSAILLVLNYSNASVSLPQAIRHPDFDFLAITLAIVVGLCVLAFTAGSVLSRALGASPSRRTSLMFGLGMNNNGTGLVLASMALPDHPRVMLPIILYNLVQHLAAGVVDRRISRQAPPPGRTASRMAPPRAAACRAPVGASSP